MAPYSLFWLFLACHCIADCCHPYQKDRYSLRGVCADGKRVGHGIYCGNGACNMFGCNCEGGCRHAERSVCLHECFKLTRRHFPNYCHQVCSNNSKNGDRVDVLERPTLTDGPFHHNRQEICTGKSVGEDLCVKTPWLKTE